MRLELPELTTLAPASAARALRRVSAARLVPIGLGAGFSVAVIFGEGDFWSLPFAFSCFAAIFTFAFWITRRLNVSILVSLAALAASAFASMAKFKHMGVNAHAVDVYFYLAKPDTLLFLAHEFLSVLASFAALVAVAGAAGIFLYRHEAPLPVSRRRAAEAFLVAAGLAAITLPKEAETIGYYIRKNHFFSSFFASGRDAVRLGQDSVLKQRLDALPPAQPFVAASCAPQGPRPDIFVILSESAVPPSHFPEWRSNPALLPSFESFDGATHKLRVETYAGGTWISAAQLLTGLSPADLDWRRPYATLFLEGRVQHSLPQHLKACGYKTVAISPLTYNFVNEGPFMRSLGIDEVLDYKAIGAATKHEADEVYYRAALDVMKRHRRSSDAPLFLFVMTMTGHSPYDYRYQPAFRFDGEPFGNSAEVDEYQRRLALARLYYADFLDELRRSPDDRGVIVAEFGDHQPIVTTPAIEAREGRDALARFTSSAYETHYSVATINRGASSALPQHPVLDLSYLGLSVLETAGLPLGPVFTELKSLREHCRGAFHTCADRVVVDQYLKRLSGSALFDPP